jgi:hypothetical protein
MKYLVTITYKLEVDPDDNQEIVDMGATVTARVEGYSLYDARMKAMKFFASTYPQKFYGITQITASSEVINA